MAKHRIEVALACMLLIAGACSHKVVGRCLDVDCAGSGCEYAAQRLPDECDEDTRMCGGSVIEDQPACDECTATKNQLNIGGPDVELHMQCACRACAVQLTACVDSAREAGGDADRDRACRDIIECSLAAGCSGTECFCGEGVDQVTCLASASTDAGTQGECARTIMRAAGCEDDPNPADCVLKQRYDLTTAIGRAVAVGSCTTGDPVFGIEGNCPLASAGRL